MEIFYSRVGDYLLPDIKLTEPPTESVEPLGRYGRLRRRFLQNHRPIQYNTLLLSEQLFPHLRKVDQSASGRLEATMADILLSSPPPDKAIDGIAWAVHMQKIRHIAENIVLNAVVYA